MNMTYVINGKEYNQEEFEKYVERKRQREYEKLRSIVYSQPYNDVTGFEEITEEQFYKDIKTSYNIMYLNEILDIGCTDKGYKTIYRITGICCNGYTSSTPACDTYYGETIFKYNARYYKLSQVSSN